MRRRRRKGGEKGGERGAEVCEVKEGGAGIDGNEEERDEEVGDALR